MDPNRWRRIEEAFNQAVAAQHAQRGKCLDAICAHDPALRSEVEALLQRHDDASDAVQESIERMAAELVAAQLPGTIGRRLGPWRLESLIARGGMGAVYLAERADGQFEQRAAVKLINPALLSAGTLQRFNGERQILARLSHPNIARLIDGGTTEEGVPWLAMEYVEGVPIDEYGKRAQLDLRQWLVLFRKVCAAIHYAHRNLIVHRDIKPSNILVDREGEPKLLDFGLAKLLETEPHRQLSVTAADMRALTPRYASPEQLRGEAITTSTDVYSLAVLLYELLVGSDPYGASSSGAHHLKEAICEREPQRPSTAVQRSGAKAGHAAAHVGYELKGDLDNILLLGLRKEPDRRYASVQELSDDIGRYLRDEPVLARPDTWRYRAGKFLKRRRTAVIAAAVVLLVLIGQSAFFVQRILSERDTAEAARLRAENIAEFLQALLRGADRFASIGKEVTVRDILESGAQRIDRELSDQPVHQARLMQTIADSYHSLSMFGEAKELATRALDLRRKHLGPNEVETLESMRSVGVLTALNGDAQAAVDILRDTLAAQLANLGPQSPEVAATRHELGTVYRGLGNPTAALEQLRAAFAIVSALPPEHDQYRFRPHIMNQIGSALDHTGDREGALVAYREALAMLESAEHGDDPVAGALQHNIGLSLRALGKLEESLPYLSSALEHTRRTLGERTEDYQVQLSSLGRVYAQLHRFEEADPKIDAALELAREIYGPEHPYYAYDVVNKARARQLQGRYEEARDLLMRAIEIYRTAYGPYHRFLAAAEVGYADVLIRLGRAREAEALVRATLERIHEDPDHERHVEAIARSVRGEALARIGEVEEARALLTQSLEDLRELLDDRHQLTAEAAHRLVAFLEAQGETAAADAIRHLLQASAEQ